MAPLLRSILLVFTATLFTHAVFAQRTPETSAGITPLKGFVRSISGETIDYNCFNPLATTALLTRCTSGDMKIEWETEPIPTDFKGEYVTFVWIASYSTTTSAGDRNFDLSINKKKFFTFKTRKGMTPKEWSLKGVDGSELTFGLVKEDAAKDANGYMYLKVSAAQFKKGKPLVITVVGEKANSSDWYMTFMYDMRKKSVEVLPMPFLRQIDSTLHQVVCVAIGYLPDSGKATISLDSGTKLESRLKRGSNIFEFPVPAVETAREMVVHVAVDNSPSESIKTHLKPVAKRTIHLLPQSHNDIGYTDIQTDVLKKQVKNIHDALELIKKTSSYPPEARFKWNVEVLWAVETFFETATEDQRKEFIEAVRAGSMGLQGLYANVLTGIMRPEEFFRLTEYARTFKERYGIGVRSAMISDVPGMSWNMVPALAQTGIKYFSSGPNGLYTGGDRTGHTNRTWADRPFYWVSPSGNERILYWMTGFGYGSFFAGVSAKNEQQLAFLKSVYRYFEWLEGISYPYDIIQMRHTINGDNGTVDPDLSEYTKTWNEKYVSPRIVISTSDQMFEVFEKKYGESLPSFSGDFTPYWEDGAASSAYELGLNRIASEQLVQTEALHAIIAPDRYEAKRFTDAWRNVLLFDEHTWGAHNSISDPDSSFATGQWRIKQQFASDASARSGELLAGIVNAPALSSPSHDFDVFNTTSWERTDLVVIPKSQSTAGDVVRDENGKEVPSQRLSAGDLAFLATGIPPLGAKRYTVGAGKPSFTRGVMIRDNTISDENLEIGLNPATGSISHFRTKHSGIDYVDRTSSSGLNEFFYVSGLDAREAQRNGAVTIMVKERGPLVASFLVESDAPGCNTLQREIRLVNGSQRVDVINTLDKKRIRTKEAVHFGFPFAVPEGMVRIDLGFGVIRPEADQLPGSCKDYYSAQRWVDVSNQEYGVTLTVCEAPLVEVGEKHSELPSPRNVAWRRTQGTSSTIFSYVMNNYWHTNYKADQEGIGTYHYSLHPHGLYNQADAMRAGIERSQPLVIRAAATGQPKRPSLLTITPSSVLVTYLKPVYGGRGHIVRLYNAGGRPEEAKISLGNSAQSVYRSSPFEEKGDIVNTVSLPANGIITLRIE